MSDSIKKYEENIEKLSETDIDVKNVNTFLGTSVGGEDFSFTRTDENLSNKFSEHKKNNISKELMESARNKGFMGSEIGAKYSDDKAPMGTMLRQFPLALQGVAQRSLYGHNKYKEFDHDWMNFKRAPDAINQYLNASVRHLAEIGDDEDSIEHLKAAAWNILATLQITLENEE